MLTLIGLTLLFVAATAALGIHMALRRARAYHPHPVWPAPILLQGGMILWCTGAGLWALFAAR